jgi:hypothetical protein
MRLVRGVSIGVAVLVALAVSLLAAPPARAASEFRFADTALRASEGQAMVRVFVQRGDLPVSRASVDYRTEPGTASPGSDYAETAGTLTFGVGETHASFPVFLRDDDVAEGPETVVLLLVDARRSEIRLTIDDDDRVMAPATNDGTGGGGAVVATSSSPTAEPRPNAVAPTAVAPAPPVVAARRPTTVVRRAPAAPRPVVVRQNPVTPFELRPAPRNALGPPVPTDVDAGLAVLAALLLARVAAEVWFRARDLPA